MAGKFESYQRVCKFCDDIYRANSRYSRTCDKCKNQHYQNRIEKLLLIRQQKLFVSQNYDN